MLLQQSKQAGRRPVHMSDNANRLRAKMTRHHQSEKLHTRLQEAPSKNEAWERAAACGDEYEYCRPVSLPRCVSLESLAGKSKSNQSATPSSSAGVPDDRASRPHMTGPREKGGNKREDAEAETKRGGG
ncbi:hypothetical protein HDV57DRAFT_503885 [Trichoderma longibrachiatum]|uniref:Uncharacterized protein n=1 Tax=Trichoderma longibrachiatum ATCC 18648 TaxID=983965 RepID=A0A2T4CEB3_TRILO|nr:hypothetical protein M440DRAFT_1105302 [Trichoderma longibrachiatum ATCC 18648]